MTRNHYHDGAYFGGKGTCFREIINRMPPHSCYVEPFLGSGAVLRHKRPAQQNIGIDIDPTVLASFPDVAGSIAGFDGIDDSQLVELAESCEAGSAEVTLICADALDWLNKHRTAMAADTIIYLDPGYLMSTRKQQRNSYHYEFATETQHGALLDLVRSLDCMVMISGYWSQLYSQELSGWNTHSFQAVTRGGTLAEEWLWYNYATPTELHDYRWVGEDFRQREKYKRRRQTVIGKLERMDAKERKAALLQIDKRFSLDVSGAEGLQPCECGCGRPVSYAGNGRPARFFSPACKQKAYRARKRNQQKSVTKPVTKL